jgi:protein-S-isoprenylcysteine O-methyltransferase Ste14
MHSAIRRKKVKTGYKCVTDYSGLRQKRKLNIKIMEAAVTFVALFISIFGVFYLYITTRNRERMAMIEKGVDPALFSPVRQPRALNSGSGVKFTLKTGMFLVGVGIGFVFSVFFEDYVNNQMLPLLVMGFIFICGGAGLVAGFYMGRILEKKDNKV